MHVKYILKLVLILFLASCGENYHLTLESASTDEVSVNVEANDSTIPTSAPGILFVFDVSNNDTESPNCSPVTYNIINQSNVTVSGTAPNYDVTPTALGAWDFEYSATCSDNTTIDNAVVSGTACDTLWFVFSNANTIFDGTNYVGTLPDGNGFSFSTTAPSLRFRPAFRGGDTQVLGVSASDNTQRFTTLTLDNPTEIIFQPTQQKSWGLAWEPISNGWQSEITTNGSDWNYTVGALGPSIISVSGQSAISQNSTTTTTNADWGILRTDNATSVTYQSWNKEGFNVSVSYEACGP